MNIDPTVKRPLIRYHGGKWMLAKRIIQEFAPHKIYVEPFAGAASVLMRKPRSYEEVVNDLNGDIVLLFKTIRDNGPEIQRLIENTPFSRKEYEQTRVLSDEPIERVRQLILRSFFGFGSASFVCGPSGTAFRKKSNRRGTDAANDWKNYPFKMGKMIERLKGVIIENRDAVDVFEDYDSPKTLSYFDPPYLLSTRYKAAGREYANEMDLDDHENLLRSIINAKGQCVVSHYANDLYDQYLTVQAKWKRIEINALADGAKPRVEILWVKPHQKEQLSLF